MINMVMYMDPEELENLTGLTHEELWDNGFNLDDWDVGFQTDRELPDGWRAIVSDMSIRNIRAGTIMCATTLEEVF